MDKYEEDRLIEKTTRNLEDKYPIEANYCSRCSLWQCGFKDGLVSNELYNAARKYYDRLWNYTGD
jgi:hypothetical protein